MSQPRGLARVVQAAGSGGGLKTPVPSCPEALLFNSVFLGEAYRPMPIDRVKQAGLLFRFYFSAFS